MPMPLDVTLPSDREVRITRSFDAPRQLVWDCHTKPALVRRWLSGPPGWSLPVCEIDLRVGGRYRYELHGPDGMKMGFGGTYREIRQPEFISNDELYDEDWTGGGTLNSNTFAEAGERTTLTLNLTYVSKEARDAALKTGMSEGLEMSFQNLDRTLAELTAD
jgi:uncharacterized protein YndB with AHSA1/START domain